MLNSRVGLVSALASSAILVALAMMSCIGDPSGLNYRRGYLALAPTFEGSTSGIVDVDRVHITLSRPADGTIVLDTTIVIGADADSVDLTLAVDIAGSSEVFVLTIECISPSGEVVFVADAINVTARSSGSAEILAETVPLSYVGVGHDAAAVEISSGEANVPFGGNITLGASALDSSGAVIAGTPIEWISHNSDRAVVLDPRVGNVVGGVERGWVHVEARLLTGQADTVDVLVEPVPSEVVVLSGDEQTGLSGTELTEEIVVGVSAVDGPVSGFSVEFSTADGGSFSPGSVSTNDQGVVSTSWTLGVGGGIQTANAVVPAVAGLQTSFTATAVVPVQPRLGFTNQPSAVDAGLVIAPAVEVTAYNAFGNVDIDFAGDVIVSIGDNPGDASLAGTLTRAATSGVVTFSDLSLSAAGNGYTLQAEAASYLPAVSEPFDVNTTIGIDDVTVTEGVDVTADFTVSLSAPSGQVVTVNWATANGTALAGSDYTTASGTVTFNPGETTQPISVSLLNDGTSEADETFVVNLSVPVNATIADGQGVATIQDDDSVPTLSVDDVTVSEGPSASTTNADFTVILSASSAQTVTVDYATADGTALAPGDYTAIGTTQLTFAPGQTSRIVTVVVQGDDVDELDETFTLNLTNPANATISDTQGVATIQDDDTVPTLSINDVTDTEGVGATSDFTVTLSAVSGQTVTVNWATANGTALAGSDYVAASGTLVFAPGETTQPVAVEVLNDGVSEVDETFNVNLSAPSNATIADGQGVATIQDDDAVPTLSINDVTDTEGVGATSDFTVTLSAVSGQTVTVSWATANGTALAGSDYTAAGGTVTFDPGETTQPISVSLLNDGTSEADETFVVNLSAPVNATIADGQGVATIQDDDAVPTLSINDVTDTEGVGATSDFTVTLSAVSGQTVTVNWATANGTALAGSDYTTASGTVTFNPGETTQPVSVSLLNDGTSEADETFVVNLSAPVNATIADGQGVATIQDDDAVPTLSINDVTDTEGVGATSDFTVTLSAVSGQTVTVNWATANGTALAGSDYTTASGTVTFNPGETTQPISVSLLNDGTSEAEETFVVNLSAPVNATIADGQGVATIQDDDAVPALSINDVTDTEGVGATSDFTVTLSAVSGQTVTVNWATANGTALAGSDYTAAGGTVTFDPGETTQPVSVSLLNDGTSEADETYVVNLSAPVNATIADGQGVATIQDDDAVPTLSINDVTDTEGVGATSDFTVTLSAVSGQTVTVNWATANGTALAGSDYTTASGTVTFDPGETTQPISVSLLNDGTSEAEETFVVNLSAPVNATIADGQGVATIQDDDAVPTLSINDVTDTEGVGATSDFTVTLSAVSGQTVTVNWATANGTALAGSDYTTAGGTLTFDPGETTQPISVSLLNDGTSEADETFVVNLSAPVNATIADGQGVATIQDDDGVPTLSIDDVTDTEGVGATSDFTVTLSAASAQTVTVNWTTADGTAVAGSDYLTASGTATFDPGVTTRPVTVGILDDSSPESDETFVVNLSGAVNASISDAQGVATIQDDGDVLASTTTITTDDPDPSVVDQNILVAFTVTASVGTPTGTVTVSDGVDECTGAVSVGYCNLVLTTEGSRTLTATYSGDALYAGSFDTEPHEVVSGATTTTITSDNPDPSVADQNILVAFTVTASVGTPTGTVTVSDGVDECTGAVSVGYCNLVLTTEGSRTLTATYSGDALYAGSFDTEPHEVVSGATTTTITSDNPDPSVADQNILVAFTVTASVGTPTGAVTVSDGVDECTGAVSVGYCNLVLTTEGSRTLTATYSGDALYSGSSDTEPHQVNPLPTLSINNVTVTEGPTATAGFMVSLSATHYQTVTVNWATANGTALAGSDYTTASGIVTFDPGETTQPVSVSLLNDGTSEADETFVVNLSTPSNATIADGQGVATIEDDDPLPTLSINNVTVTEGVGVTAGFTVSLSAASGQTVTANWITANNTALAGSDYTGATGTVTFAPGQVTRPVNVSILDDALQESNETFYVNLSGPVNATIADGQGLGTIQDDGDAPPAATDGFATGTSGRNWRYNEGSDSWIPQVQLDCGSCLLWGVWGTAANDVFAVGSASSIRHYNGTSWETQTPEGITTARAVWGTASNNVFIVGQGGTYIERFDGSSWSSMTSGLSAGSLYGVSGTSSSDVFAVGWDLSAGVILHYDGGSWSPMTHSADVTLDGVWAAAPDDVFVVGDGGTILHYNGSGWSTMTSGTTENLNDVWGTASDDVYAVGENGTIRHYNGSSWSAMAGVPATTSAFTGIWGTSSTDLFVVGTSTGTTTWFLHYNGTSWVHQEPLAGNLAVLDVWVP